MSIELSIVMPCLNEQETIGTCIKKAKSALERLSVCGEIVIADNGSTDRSVEIAEALGARVIREKKKGYGSAYLSGVANAQGKFILMGDSDDSYDFSNIDGFVKKLREGFELVMGTRIRGTIEKGAMPWLHRYIGNPILTGILNLFFHTGISDAHCGMRACTKEAFNRMALRTRGMEFASEMVIRAKQVGLKITEIPITLHPDGRSGKPHLRSFRDGWRHLRFMLMESPTYLYLLPGGVLFLIGLIFLIALLPGPFFIGWHKVDMHGMVFASFLTLLGFQIISLGIFAKTYSFTHGYRVESRLLKRMYKVFNLEKGILIGAVILSIGLIPDFYIFFKWFINHFGELNDIRLALFASTLTIIGSQIIFSSFYLSMLGMGQEEN